MLCDLDFDLAQQLERVLKQQDVTSEFCLNLDTALQRLEETCPDVVFCGFTNSLNAFLDAVSSKRRKIPVIVVSRHPEVNQWIDALEAGAADYCAAPFEPTHMRWVLATASLAAA
ncbi:MAG: hypothetical protein NZV14_14740 [Bryobacteraceae bacterium]|nr:hypothetical protein [Bryobacteraceae bacterium]MDW8379420.1 hypothetical protein [Bryobacterales bacterium]